jgi:acetyltransferase-like isoleucine patch superfamily enzyme
MYLFSAFMNIILTEYIKYRLKLKSGANVQIGVKSRFIKNPIIKMVTGTKLFIGENVIMNSDKVNYHLNMHSPCKILLDRKGGEIHIGKNTRIHGTCIHAYESIKIGDNCLIAANTQIMDGNGHDLSFDNVANRIKTKGTVKPVIIEDNVWIGTGVIVLPGVVIGKGSVISANSVVSKSIPEMCIAAGNPALVIKTYTNLNSLLNII